MTKNINSPLINVYHSCLKRADNSRYRSLCPVCQHGTLLMVRDQVSMVLEEYDRCVLCGQQFRYMDIERLRDREDVMKWRVKK
jgi:hypothetical protein